jgi:hypothetical protein
MSKEDFRLLYETGFTKLPYFLNHPEKQPISFDCWMKYITPWFDENNMEIWHYLASCKYGSYSRDAARHKQYNDILMEHPLTKAYILPTVTNVSLISPITIQPH